MPGTRYHWTSRIGDGAARLVSHCNGASGMRRQFDERTNRNSIFAWTAHSSFPLLVLGIGDSVDFVVVPIVGFLRARVCVHQSRPERRPGRRIFAPLVVQRRWIVPIHWGWPCWSLRRIRRFGGGVDRGGGVHSENIIWEWKFWCCIRHTGPRAGSIRARGVFYMRSLRLSMYESLWAQLWLWFLVINAYIRELLVWNSKPHGIDPIAVTHLCFEYVFVAIGLRNYMLSKGDAEMFLLERLLFDGFEKKRMDRKKTWVKFNRSNNGHSYTRLGILFAALSTITIAQMW